MIDETDGADSRGLADDSGRTSPSDPPPSRHRRRRPPHRNHRRRRCAPTAAGSNVFACLIYLWAVRGHRSSPLLGDDHRARTQSSSSWAAEAFGLSDGRLSPSPSWRKKRQFSSRALMAARTSALPPVVTSCEHFSAMTMGVPRSRLWGAGIILSRLPHNSNGGDGSSLLICRSTISDETTEAEITLAEATHSGQINESNDVYGDIATAIKNGNKINGQQQLQPQHQQQKNDNTNTTAPKISDDDVPVATANGGYTHTASSKAKISAANKGKTPWNKGQARSAETRARIAEGVRRRNREKFLAELAAEGITEEEHLERKKAERRKKDAARRARRTAKGGYTPTEETKQKISRILKEKYANGEVKRKPRDPSKIRRGFRHSEETKAKIRETLRRKWAEDEEYRALMTNKTVASGNVSPSVRNRIAETMKKRWEEPEFRAKMMDKFKKRRRSSGTRHEDHKKKISEAMKRKWMDEEYRRRATEGMAKGRERGGAAARGGGAVAKLRPVQPKMPRRKAEGSLRPTPAVRKVAATKAATKRAPRKKTITGAKRKRKKAAKRKLTNKQSGGAELELTKVVPERRISKEEAPERKISKEEAPERKISKEEDPDGSIQRMREERRDLYELLYGDDEDVAGGPADGKDDGGGMGRPVVGERDSSYALTGMASGSVAALLGGDEDLDDFDPYGLHDAAPSATRGR